MISGFRLNLDDFLVGKAFVYDLNAPCYKCLKERKNEK